MRKSPYPLLCLLLILLLCLGCSRKAYVEGEKQWDYQSFRDSQSSYTSKDGIIKYIDRGEGEVILLLHGVPSSSWLYRKMIDGLVDGGHRVIAPDMLGYGNSANPDGYNIYGPEAHAERLLGLMDHLNIPRWTQVMHDAGGLWTWAMLGIDKSTVKRLIVLNSIIYESGFEPPVRMKPGIFAKISMWAYTNGITTNFLLRQLFKIGLQEDNLTKQEVEGYKKPLREGKVKGMYAFFTKTEEKLPNYSELLKSLDIPSMIIWGKHDEMLMWAPQSQAVKSDLNIKDSDVHILEAKHFIQEEKPNEINKLILEFVNRE